MKKVLLCVLAIAGMNASAATPQDSVNQTIGKLLSIASQANESAKISKMCALIRSDLEVNYIGTSLLGTFASLQRDAAGIAAFKKLVPSIIVDQFYGLVADKGGAAYQIGGTVPKGSERVGVKVKIAKTDLVVTVLKANNKIVDVEYKIFSLVKTKADELEDELQRNYRKNRESSLPVSDLVSSLKSQGVSKCN